MVTQISVRSTNAPAAPCPEGLAVVGELTLVREIVVRTLERRRDDVRSLPSLTDLPSDWDGALVLIPRTVSDVDGFRAWRASRALRGPILIIDTDGLVGDPADLVRGGRVGIVGSAVCAEEIEAVLHLIGAGYAVLSGPAAGKIAVSDVAAPVSADVPCIQFEGISARERDVLHALSGGLSDKEIARDLGISVGTVRVHVREILRKLGVPNRTRAALLYLDRVRALRA